jgi:hypothetical protein
VSGFAEDAIERRDLHERIARLSPTAASDWRTAPLAALRSTARAIEDAAANRRRHGGTAGKFAEEAGITLDD